MTTYSTGICQLTTDFNVEFSQPWCSKQNTVLVISSCVALKSNQLLSTHSWCVRNAQKIKVIPGTGLIMCQQCNREYLIENVKNNVNNSYQMTFSLDLRNDRNDVSATVFSSTLSELISENVLLAILTIWHTWKEISFNWIKLRLHHKQ